MKIISNIASALSFSAVLAASLGAGCLSDAGAAQGDEREGLDETAQESGGITASVTPLPSFATTPSIQQAIAKLSDPRAIAVAETISGFQIYRCEQGTAAPEWKLRTPLAGLAPSFAVQRPVLNRERLAGLVGAYHYRSDFGGLVAPAQLTAIGLVAPTTAPVWDFTFQPSGGALRREVLAGRVLAQDATSTENIPMLLLEVRGRSIDAGTPSALAPATHLLRWNTRGGVAPAASTCTAETLGREAQSPYAAEYYFLQTAP